MRSLDKQSNETKNHRNSYLLPIYFPTGVKCGKRQRDLWREDNSNRFKTLDHNLLDRFSSSCPFQLRCWCVCFSFHPIRYTFKAFFLLRHKGALFGWLVQFCLYVTWSESILDWLKFRLGPVRKFFKEIVFCRLRKRRVFINDMPACSKENDEKNQIRWMNKTSKTWIVP